MAMSPFNIFVATNSILNQKTYLKRPKTRGRKFIPGSAVMGWDNITKTIHASWDNTPYNISSATFDVVFWSGAPLVPWKKLNWKNTKIVYFNNMANPVDGYDISVQWEKVWGLLPSGSWIIPYQVQLFWGAAINSTVTHVYSSYFIMTN